MVLFIINNRVALKSRQTTYTETRLIVCSDLVLKTIVISTISNTSKTYVGKLNFRNCEVKQLLGTDRPNNQSETTAKFL